MSEMHNLLGGVFFKLLLINITFLIVLLRLIFFRFSKDRDSLFGFFIFGNGVFIVTHLLQGVEISLGFAFGLFAIFAMLRYRTESISIRNMTYLFLVIVISLVNGVAPLDYLSLTTVNVTALALVILAETNLFATDKHLVKINYEKIENISPERKKELFEDLSKRTGLSVCEVKVVDIDFLNDTANIEVYYKDSKN